VLKTWFALRYDHILEGGRTKPLVVDCSLDGERRLFVAKIPGLPEVDQRTVCRELLGNLVAQRLGVNVPAPALIEISEEFVAAVNPDLREKRVQIKPGMAAGCEYVSGGLASFLPQYLTSPLLPDAALIYAFDGLVQNPDRTSQRPNCAVLADRLLAYDFDMAFSFLYAIGISFRAWEVSRHGIADRHLFRDRLRGRAGVSFSWQQSCEEISLLSDEVLADLCGWVPTLFEANLEAIKTHLSQVRDHVDDFKMELQASLGI
jgi:hypothetical protein